MRPVSTVARLPHAIARPFEQFFGVEVAGGAILLTASVAALIWANAPGDSYHEFWSRTLGGSIAGLDLDLTLDAWLSEGLMAMFFFVVGLEIKREFVRGELSDPRAAALPVAAALGGMALPAAIYASLNLGADSYRGWGIPMATDIAFSVGLLALLGPRVPVALKVFLLALAIVDDLGAIAVIAVFYTEDLSPGWLGAAAAVLSLAAVAGARWAGAWRALVPVFGVLCWLALHEAGVHATIAGAALGLLTPAGLRASSEPADGLRWLEHTLHPWVSYVIVPLFALASAGVELGAGAIGDAVGSRVAIGVVLGLAIGKPVGIAAAAYAAVRLGIGVLPRGATWAHIAGVGMVAGVGFTVSIFIAGLAFDDPALVDEAKIGILAGSLAVGVAGLVVLRIVGQEGGHAAETATEGDPDFS